MIRKARIQDLDAIEQAYDEHFQYESEHTAYTVFKKGVYPTREGAQKAIEAGTMYVYEDGGELCGSVIIDDAVPEEYANVPWNVDCTDKEVLIMHLLMVRPSKSGRGIATAIIEYAADFAREQGCKALRLDTGGQNIPAVHLYEKNGFEIVLRAPKKVGGLIAHNDHLYLERKL